MFRFTRSTAVAVLLLSALVGLGLIGASQVSATPNQVTVCHRTGNSWHPISVSWAASAAHLLHGDWYPSQQRPCPPVTPTPVTPTGTPTNTDTPPTATYTFTPTNTNVPPTETFTLTPTNEATEDPTMNPTEEPTTGPTDEPTVQPTNEVTPDPTNEGTDEPDPTVVPTGQPTGVPAPQTNNERGPAYIPAPFLVQVCVFGRDLPGVEYGDPMIRWQARNASGVFVDVVPLSVTGIERRFVKNPTLGVETDHDMSCLVLVDEGVYDDASIFRAVDNTTGQPVGEWITIYFTNSENTRP